MVIALAQPSQRAHISTPYASYPGRHTPTARQISFDVVSQSVQPIDVEDKLSLANLDPDLNNDGKIDDWEKDVYSRIQAADVDRDVSHSTRARANEEARSFSFATRLASLAPSPSPPLLQTAGPSSHRASSPVPSSTVSSARPVTRSRRPTAPGAAPSR